MKTTDTKISRIRRRKARGQTLIIVILLTVGLVAVVGLALDGGSALMQRRTAQNAADGAALASTKVMLNFYRDMVESNDRDIDGSSGEEDTIRATIDSYLSRNGALINPARVEVYFVNDGKQVVTSGVGENGCGANNPCQVGANGSVPWTLGAKGIFVRATSEVDAYLLSVVGWRKISAVADATAYMGIAVDSDLALLPIGFFTDTDRLDQLIVGQTYTLINGSTRQGSGNWGYIDFNGNGNPAGMVNAWIACGYRATVTEATWPQWCPQFPGRTEGAGPTMYWTGINEPLAGPFYQRTVQWPPDPNGWWLAGSSGTTNSTCQFFEDMIDEIRGREFLIPVFDRSNGQGGDNTKFHLIGLAWFRITDMDIYCHPRLGEEAHWSIQGEFLQKYSAGSGIHGDVRRTSNPTVFLEP